MNFKLIIINLFALFAAIQSVSSESDQLINFVPDTNDFDLIASESINNQYSSVLDLTTDEYLRECVAAHNEKRRLHGVDELVYDEKVRSFANPKVITSQRSSNRIPNEIRISPNLTLAVNWGVLLNLQVR